MNRRLCLDSRGDWRFLRREGIRRAFGAGLATIFTVGKEGAKQADLKENRGKGVKGGGIAALGALHGNAEAERGLGDAVIKQDDSCDDFKEMTFHAVENPLDIMDKDYRILERIQFVGADASAEAESSEDTGQAAEIDRHPKVALQQRARVGAIGIQIADAGLFGLCAGYEVQTGITEPIDHACTSGRSLVQTCRKETLPFRSKDSVLAHGAHCVRSLPERRSQMFPQRSQYFSSIFRSCDGSDLSFIILFPLDKLGLYRYFSMTYFVIFLVKAAEHPLCPP
jgi:hypothetical protein